MASHVTTSTPAGTTLLVRVKIVVVAAAAKPALGSLYDVAGLPDGLANQHRSTGLPGSAKQTTMGLFKSPWRSKVAAVAAFQSPEPPAEEPAPPPPPPPPGRDAATIVEGLKEMTDAVEAARVALALPPRHALAPRAFVQRSSPAFPSQANRALEREWVHDFALLRDLEEVHRGRASRDLPRGVHVLFPRMIRDAAHHLLETFASRSLRGSHGLALSALVKDLEDDGEQSLARRGR